MRPRRGSALVFFPSSDAGVPDPASLHAALPVAGDATKWICTIWVRQREADSDLAAVPGAGLSLGQRLLSELHSGSG